MLRQEINKIASYLYHSKIDLELHSEIWSEIKNAPSHNKSDVKISKELEAKIQKYKAAAARYYTIKAAAKKRRK